MNLILLGSLIGFLLNEAVVLCQTDCSRFDFNKVDVVFALDGSGSVKLANFDVAKNFLKDVIGQLKVGPNDASIGVLQYPRENRASLTATEIDLGTITDNDALQNAIDPIVYQNGELTNTDQAIKDSVAMLKRRGRKNYPKIIVVITDGLSNHPDQTTSAADDARKQKTTLISVGVTNSINREELTKIAGSSSRVLTVYDFEALVKFVTTLSDAIRKYTNEKCYVQEEKKISAVSEQNLPSLTGIPIGETIGLQCTIKPPKAGIKWTWLKDGEVINHPNAVEMVTMTDVEYKLGWIADAKSSGQYVLRVTYPNGLSKTCPPFTVQVNDKLPPVTNDDESIDKCRNGIFNKVFYENDVPKYCVIHVKEGRNNGKCMNMTSLYKRLSQLKEKSARQSQSATYHSYEYKRFNLQVLGNVYGTEYTNEDKILATQNGFDKLFIEGLDLIQETHPEINFVEMDGHKFGPIKFCEMALTQFPYAANLLEKDVVPQECPKTPSRPCLKSTRNRRVISYPTNLNLVYYKDRETPTASAEFKLRGSFSACSYREPLKDLSDVISWLNGIRVEHPTNLYTTMNNLCPPKGCFIPKRHVEHNKKVKDQCISINDAVNILNKVDNRDHPGKTAHGRWPLAGVLRVYENPYNIHGVDPVYTHYGSYTWNLFRSPPKQQSIPEMLVKIDTALGYSEDQKVTVTINNMYDHYGTRDVTVSYQAFCAAIIEMIPVDPVLFNMNVNDCPT